jgi:eukaryotic-like serine/threonine-protein kinase
MSKPPDEEEDQIFSGKALGEDGALKPASGVPLLNEVPLASSAPSPAPPVPGASLLDDPAYEPTVISIPPRVRNVADRPTPVELAETRPPPMSSDYVAPRAEKPPRFDSPDIPWGKWVLRVALLGVVVAGGWVVVTGKLPLGKFSLDLLRSGSKKEEATEKRKGTPAPTLLVLSDPSGATVLVGGAEVGVTPWAGDNVWPSKEPLRVEVRKAGYKPWVGLTQGGQQATLEANLKKR